MVTEELSFSDQEENFCSKYICNTQPKKGESNVRLGFKEGETETNLSSFKALTLLPLLFFSASRHIRRARPTRSVHVPSSFRTVLSSDNVSPIWNQRRKKHFYWFQAANKFHPFKGKLINSAIQARMVENRIEREQHKCNCLLTSFLIIIKTKKNYCPKKLISKCFV